MSLREIAFNLLYRWAIDGDENENLRSEILAMGGLIDELEAEIVTDKGKNVPSL